ncbi:MAG: DUF2130 domain-containing protein, partial [Sulfurospirillum sp.]
MSKTTIKCPNCGTEIDVNEILYHQLESELKQKNLQEQKKLKDEALKKEQELQKQQEALKIRKEKFDEELKKATSIQLKVEKQKLQEQLKKELEEEQSESIALLKKEL